MLEARPEGADGATEAGLVQGQDGPLITALLQRVVDLVSHVGGGWHSHGPVSGRVTAERAPRTRLGPLEPPPPSVVPSPPSTLHLLSPAIPSEPELRSSEWKAAAEKQRGMRMMERV